MASKRYDQFTAATPVSTDIILFGDPSTGELNKAAISVLNESVLGYKVYAALLTQTSANAPVITVIENTTGFTFESSYDGQGSYIITPVTGSPFVAGKCGVIFGPPYNSPDPTGPSHIGSFIDVPGNGIVIKTYGSNGSLTDELLAGTFFELKLYP